MKSFKKNLGFFALLLMLGLAAVLPIPIIFYRKDNMPKFKTEQIDKKQEDQDKSDTKVIF
ncbi:hypothetical protein [Algibacter sp. PT7-4]|uniref:hypothetical protein n=1 Tax=Algibacter ulvanivorans TaxID=3400999 RepID=UPI003AAAF387